MIVDTGVEEQAGEDREDEGPEKIEVHVHVHRGAGGERVRRAKPAPRAELTGALFDWKEHYDRVCLSMPEHKLEGWARLRKCHHCLEPLPLFAERCSRCATPRSRRRLRMWIGAVTLGLVAVVFAICAHALHIGPMAERPSLAPIGQWSDDDTYYDVIEVPVPTSPFTGSGAPPSEPHVTTSTDHFFTSPR